MCKWEDNNKINLREIRLEGVDWIHLTQISLVASSFNKVANLQVP